MKNNSLLFIFFFFISISVAQTYTGTVLDQISSQPLEGAIVYFDGTTMGVVTDEQGVFNIELKNRINAPLVISFLGYETKVFDKATLIKHPIIKMVQKPSSLDEVLLSDDDWSRQKKLNHFRREFLGKTNQSKSCKILNEDKIILKYSKVNNILYAFADEPIVIKNNYLGYIVTYNLIDFEINFKTSSSGLSTVEKVFYSGTTRFNELDTVKIKKKFIKRRDKAYTKSLLHFMRSLTNNNLKENGFRLFTKDPSGKSKLMFETNQSSVFEINKTDKKGTKVKLLKDEEILVKLKTFEQSLLISTSENKIFYIDDLGWFYPIDSLLFSGHFGDSRITFLLPSDYKISQSKLD